MEASSLSPAGSEQQPARPTILDCTIRDGSCAIDFRFTAADTATVVGLLSEAGLRWIEICDGWGLGAAARRTDRRSASDSAIIERSKDRAGAARIGAFFVPWLGSERDVREAAAAGLDFIRIGHNADEIEEVMPVVELARELGLHVFVNFMKTYGVPERVFGRGAARAVAHGAQGVYVVDSAGGMLPTEVASYVTAGREQVDVPIGFHGHNNLQLAVANSIAALEAGATLVDGSLSGIGRSAGNAPTELIAAVVERMGLESDVDPLALIDLAEAYMTPISSKLRPYNMTTVAVGLGRFYSAYLPRTMNAAREAGINPLRLIVELGRRNPMLLPADLLEQTVAALRDTNPPAPSQGRLDAFPRDEASRDDDKRDAEAFDDLLDGLTTIAGKLQLTVVLTVEVSSELQPHELIAEYVLHDETMALGRLRCGSCDLIHEALTKSVGGFELVLAGPGVVLPELSGRVVPFRPDALALEYLGDVALARAAGDRYEEILIVDDGDFASADVQALAKRLGAVRCCATDQVPGALTIVAGYLSTLPHPDVVAFAARSTSEPPTGLLIRDDCLRGTLSRWQRALAAVPAPDIIVSSA